MYNIPDPTQEESLAAFKMEEAIILGGIYVKSVNFAKSGDIEMVYGRISRTEDEKQLAIQRSRKQWGIDL